MGITVEQFRPYHLELLKAQGVQGAQAREVSLVPAHCAKLLRPAGPCLTVFDAGRVILCGGIVISPEFSMGILWAVLSEHAAKHLLALHRGTERFIEFQRLRRIEATVEEGFTPGCRWLSLLGFEYEGKMRGFGIGGETHLRYARVR